MVKKGLVCLLAVLFALSMAGAALADEISGAISNVADGGKVITVKGDDGKEVELKVSGKRTSIKGVGSPKDLKAGQKVKVTFDGDEAKAINVQ